MKCQVAFNSIKIFDFIDLIVLKFFRVMNNLIKWARVPRAFTLIDNYFKNTSENKIKYEAINFSACEPSVNHFI